VKELKPCPFCGSSARESCTYDFDGPLGPEVGFFVRCQGCGAKGPTFWVRDGEESKEPGSAAKAKAIEGWQRGR